MSLLKRVVGAIATWFSELPDEDEPLQPEEKDYLRSAIPAWIEAVTQKNVLPQTCVAVYLGLAAEEHTYLVYFVGSDTYDPYDDEWIIRHDFVPVEWQLDTHVSDRVSGDVVQDIVEDVVRRILESDTETILHQCPHVSVGYGRTQHIR